MFEVFFILTIIYLAYAFSASTTNNASLNTASLQKNVVELPVNIISTPTTSQKVAPQVVQKKLVQKPKKAPQAVAKPKVNVAATRPVKKTKINKKAAPKIELRTVQMTHPKTGEQVKVANNYRMVKRWIKEALVEEGLLDKIYTTKEMDDAAKIKVRDALSIIKAMDKYKPQLMAKK
ncbi:MAG: hypothetical protein GQ582_03985 [Methyloprofundus sp.]|nr:hypothetical protein [Methyloprofundus sp.]